MKTLRNWTVQNQTPHGVTLLVDDQHVLQITALAPRLFRVSLLRQGKWRNPRSWSIAPNGSDTPWQGRPRDQLEGFDLPRADFDAETATLSTDHLRVQIKMPLALEWSHRSDQDAPWQNLAADRPQAAYMLGAQDHRNAHFLRRNPGERVYGLGEKTGALERSGRRFEMRNLDAMGYDAQSTDPLYKHLPFTATLRPDGSAFGVFYDNLSTMWFDIGNELDNYHPAFRSYRALDGDLDYYIFAGSDLLSVVKTYHRLIGGMTFMPLWGLGYSGSSMALADADDGQTQITSFLERCQSEGIGLDSFQMSSGYTSIGAKRYVFNWNTDRFPDVAAMCDRFEKAGVRLIGNIKPVLLDDHPRYPEAAAAGLFIREHDSNQPEHSAFWDGLGSHLDMTNSNTVAWWQDNLRHALLAQGITSSWNDNNEYEVWEDGAVCAGFGAEINIGQIRPLHGMLMTRASYEEQMRFIPDERPYLISRSAAPGTQRYAQSWTGDNRTNWDSLRHNIPMGLGLSLSGYYNIGHDVGGFAGPPPGPELFLRWVQNGIFHPRFTIHSWNDDGSSNVPWMHPEVVDDVKAAMALRYRLMPYLYTQIFRAAHRDEPILRPTFLDHPHDETCHSSPFDFMLGPWLLVATVVEEGATQREVYLPEDPAGWWCFHTGQWHSGGQWLRQTVDLSSIPLFVRGGTVLPLAKGSCLRAADTLRARELAVFPAGADSGTRQSQLYEDDGLAVDALAGNHCLFTFDLTTKGPDTVLSWQRQGRYDVPYQSAQLILPKGFTGRLVTPSGSAQSGEYLSGFQRNSA